MADRDYAIVGPGGRELTITGPDNATPEQLRAAAERAFARSPAAPQPKAKADPTEGMSTGEKVLAGVGKAIADTGRGIKQLIDIPASALERQFGGQDVSRALGMPSAQESAAQTTDQIAESRRLDAPLMNTGAGFAGNVGGNILMTLAPGGALKGAETVARGAGAVGAANALGAAGSAAIAPTTLRGAATLGAGMGAIQPALSDTERLTNIGIGAGAGAGGQGAVNALARIVRPNTAPAVRTLLDEGVTPTPGQILGGGFNRAEEGLTSVPIVGDAIKAGRLRAASELNTAAMNRALAPIGQKLPAGLTGRDAIEHVGNALGQQYDAILPRLTTSADGQFIAEVQNLRNMVGNGAIDPAKAAQFEAILNNQVLTKFQGPNATLTGQTVKEIDGDLGQLSAKFHGSPDPDQRLLGDAIQETQRLLRENVLRNNPQFAPQLRNINEGYANFKRVQRAAAGLGADEGVFSAAQLQNAVKTMDRSKDKAAFARGDALMQDLSEPAKTVLGARVPDSGTPFRSMLALGAGGAAGGLVGPGTAAAVLAAPAMYSRVGQNALATLLARRGAAADPIANSLRQIAPYATAPSIGYSE